jgi:hypothetical protein
VPVRFADLAALFETGDVAAYVRGTAAREQARHFFYYVYGYHLRPTSLTVYEREAFVGRFDPTLRITFDRNLRGKGYPSWPDLRSDAGLRHVHPGFFVLEVKFNTWFPAWLRPVLGRYGLRSQSVSKYCLCVETGRGEADSPVAVRARAAGLGRRPDEPGAPPSGPVPGGDGQAHGLDAGCGLTVERAAP